MIEWQEYRNRWVLMNTDTKAVIGQVVKVRDSYEAFDNAIGRHDGNCSPQIGVYSNLRLAKQAVEALPH